MERLEDHPGLASGEGWSELAYATGDADWPLARVRVTPQTAAQDNRIHEPNAPAVPPRVEVRMSASLVGADGAVLRIQGKLLVGLESTHSWQFDADTAFAPAAWLDACAERMISDLIRQARGLSAAADAGLLLH